jgi:hypothetical protein
MLRSCYACRTWYHTEMSKFESREARIAAENAAIKQLLNFANTEPRFAPDVATFREQTDHVMDSLSLAVQGVARLCPETAQMSYEAKTAKPPHNVEVVRVPGRAAYNLFIGRRKHSRENYGEGGSFIEVAPSKGSLTVYASYVPLTHDERSSVEITTEDSVGTQIIEGSTELNADTAAFTYRSKGGYAGLVLSRKTDPEIPYLDGGPATDADVAATLYDPSMSRAFEEGGLYGLGSYFVWRSVRNLQEIVELPPNAI